MSVRKIKSLFAKLARLKSEIETEKKAVYPDWLRLRHLKKIRLRIKDQLARLAAKPQSGPEAPPHKRRHPRYTPSPRTGRLIQMRRNLRVRS